MDTPILGAQPVPDGGLLILPAQTRLTVLVVPAGCPAESTAILASTVMSRP